MKFRELLEAKTYKVGDKVQVRVGPPGQWSNAVITKIEGSGKDIVYTWDSGTKSDPWIKTHNFKEAKTQMREPK